MTLPQIAKVRLAFCARFLRVPESKLSRQLLEVCLEKLHNDILEGRVLAPIPSKRGKGKRCSG